MDRELSLLLREFEALYLVLWTATSCPLLKGYLSAGPFVTDLDRMRLLGRLDRFGLSLDEKIRLLSRVNGPVRIKVGMRFNATGFEV